MYAKSSSFKASASDGKESNDEDDHHRHGNNINRVAESKTSAKDPSHFSKVQSTNLISQGERNLQQFLDCCAENMKISPWQFVMRRSDLFDLELYYVKVANSKYNRWQSTSLLPYRMEDIVPLVVNGDSRITWDHTMANFEKYPIEGTSEISLQRYGSKAVGPISGRDSCVISVTRSYDNGARVVCAGSSIPSSIENTAGLIPEVPGSIRMEIMNSGFLFERCGENGNETKVGCTFFLTMRWKKEHFHF